MQANIPKGWNPLINQPPNEFVGVIDADGNTAIAEPTYYPFKVVKMAGDERKQWGWRGTPIWYADNLSRWDGGWMICANGMEIREIGEIIGWKKIEQSKAA